MSISRRTVWEPPEGTHHESDTEEGAEERAFVRNDQQHGRTKRSKNDIPITPSNPEKTGTALAKM